MPSLLPSPNGRPAADRERIVALLAGLTADGVALRLAARVAHWNVRGPYFGPLHALFGDLSDAIDGYVDDLAERAATLGGLAIGTVEQVAASSRLAAYPAETTDGVAHLRELATLATDYLETLRAARAECAAEGWSDTYDLLTDVTRGLEKWGWKLLAHIPGRAAPGEPDAAQPTPPAEGDGSNEVMGG